MPLDIQTIRADTPGSNELVHLNNAGCSLTPQPVLQAVTDYLAAETRRGGYRLEVEQQDQVYRYQKAGASLLGSKPTEIAFAGSATQAWWNALGAVELAAGDRVLASSAEYVANVFGLIQLRNRGILVDLIPTGQDGCVDTSRLGEMMDDRVKLVCITHIPTEGGLVNPVAEIGQLLSGWPALYLVDACQSVGQMPVSVTEIGCDFLVTTGRKFLRAPRGSGLLYARHDIAGLQQPVVMDGRTAEWSDAWEYRLPDTANRFETYEASMAVKTGLGVAIDYACSVGLDNIETRVSNLSTELRGLLQGLVGVNVKEHSGTQSGIVTFDVSGQHPDAVVEYLRQHNVTTSAVKPTHATFDPTGRYTFGLVRASVHYFNTEDDLVVLVSKLERLLAE